MAIDFFDAPNRIRPEGSDAVSRLASMVSPDAVVSVLPWNDGTGIRWYVTVDDSRFEQVREEVHAHVGVSYTDFRGQPTPLDLEDPGDLRMHDFANDNPVIRIALLSASAEREVSEALERFLSLWAMHPEEREARQRPVAELLADYRLAMQAGCRDDAEEAVRLLRASGGLEVTNLHFIELELRSVFESPAAVLTHPRLDSLLLIRRPARVTDMLIRAVDQAQVRWDGASDPEVLRGRFGSLDPAFQNLITDPGECRSSAGVLFLALRNDAYGRTSDDVRNWLPSSIGIDEGIAAILHELWGSDHESTESPDEMDEDTSSQGDRQSAVSAVVAVSKGGPLQFSTETSTVALGLADLLAVGDYRRVLETAVSCDVVTIEILDAALRAAQWLDSMDAARQALLVLDAAPGETRDRFTQNRLIAPLVEALRGLTESDAPRPANANWNDFFENLERDPQWSGALETAEHGVLEWSTEGFLADQGAIDRLVNHIAIASDLDSPIFRQVVPLLVEWLGKFPDAARPMLLDSYEALLVHLSLRDETRAGLALLGEFASELIASGLSASRYDFCLDNIEARWSVSQSPAAIGWAAEFLECLLDNPCPDRGRRQGLAGHLLSGVGPLLHRAEPSLQDLVRELSKELALEPLLPAEEIELQESPLPDLLEADGVTIGLYSLTPGALQRAKASLEAKWSGLTVKTRSDKDGSGELASLARSADAMIVAWKSSKHAATECIEAGRGPTRPPILAEGKGSASLIRAAENFLYARL